MSVNKKSTFEYAHVFLCFSLDLTLLSSWKLHWGDLYWRVCRMMTKDEAQEVHRHRALCHPQLFPQLFPPMSCPTSCVGFKSKSPNISPFPHTLSSNTLQCPYHPMWSGRQCHSRSKWSNAFPRCSLLLKYWHTHNFTSSYPWLLIIVGGGW